MGLAWATFRININSNREEIHRDSVGCCRGPDWKHAVLGHRPMCTFYIPIDLFANKRVWNAGVTHLAFCFISVPSAKQSCGRKRGREIKREEKDWKFDFKCLWIAISQCVGRWCRGDILSIFILWTALLHSWQERMRWEYCEISVKFQWLHVWCLDQSNWGCNFSYNTH